MSQVYSIRGKTVKIFPDGQIFVGGKFTNIKQWSYDSTRYSNVNSGSELNELRGMDLESALRLKGWI